MATCDGCGKDVDEKELREFKFFGKRSLICRECVKFHGAKEY